MRPLLIYDATLREGAQGMGASFSMEDKMRIAHILDDLGVPVIEAGNPGSTQKDAEFYHLMRSEKLHTARLAAFGPTCRLGALPQEDEGIAALLACETPIVTLFGKAWDFHVTDVLGASLSQNIDLIASSIAYLTARGREVVFDAEHFFDGMKRHPEYAMKVLQAAREAGASYLALCDTNGGCFPGEIRRMTEAVVAAFGDCVGIHAHNDTGMAEANTIEGVLAGAVMAQVTAGGMGERCGNADLFVTAPNLQLKLGYACLPDASLPRMTEAARKVRELCNLRPDPRRPYTGTQAFSHKAGMHIDGVLKHPSTFEHIQPEQVGNERQFLLSEIAGRAAVAAKIARFFPEVDKKSEEAAKVVEHIKRMEYLGYQYEGADASFELAARRLLHPFPPFFELKNFKVIIMEPAPNEDIATAAIEIVVDGQSEITADHGNGPVNALDKAARKALERFYPQLRQMQLSDYKVRVLDSADATASRVRVLIESKCGAERWSTVGVSGDVIGASWMALVDSLEYMLLKCREGRITK